MAQKLDDELRKFRDEFLEKPWNARMDRLALDSAATIERLTKSIKGNDFSELERVNSIFSNGSLGHGRPHVPNQKPRNIPRKVYPRRTCFISHTWADDQHLFAKIVHKRLERYDGISSWLDEQEIKPGDHIYDRINVVLEREIDVFICILSPQYLKSGNCKAELSKAARMSRDNKIRLIPLLLGHTPIPLELEGLLFVDCTKITGPQQKIMKDALDTAMKQLVRGIRT
jgi:hypothetical protein